MSTRVLVDGDVVAVALTRAGDEIVANVDGREVRGTVRRRNDMWTLDGGGDVVTATVVRAGADVWVAIDGEVYRCGAASNARAETGTGATASPRVTAPMPGKVLDVLVTDGQTVAAGDSLVVLEAMKMETVTTADAAGRVVRVHVAPGAMVEPGQVLVELDFS